MSVLFVVGAALALITCAVAQTGPAILVRPPANTVAWTSQTVRWTCVAYGSPLPTVTWADSDGNTITGSSSSVQISTATQDVNGKAYRVSTLQLCNVQTGMTGQYSCTATGGSSAPGITSKTASFFLQVSAPDTDAAAVLVTPTATNTVNEKSVVEFVCIAYGNPLPIITWSRSGIPNITSNTLSNAKVTTKTLLYGDVAFQKSVLQLCGVSGRDQDGSYMCKAENGVTGDGIAPNWATFSLTVNALPFSSSSTSATHASSSETMPLASETSYQAAVGILVVIVVLLIVFVTITAIWMFLAYKKGKEEVTLRQAPSRPPPATNLTFEAAEEEGGGDQGVPDDEELDDVKDLDYEDDGDKNYLVS